ncbi:hypothetical protein PAXRUDRAFT_831610 [Paxillus rubicundulus Ve08.2h10]|uniref:Uncharacterized protein n=1 Tax=Paxillus rubicundulus Ve08.2h10 TaxID=930991 RepID=A0A0D0DWN9_9AGAM|nr:hypothetical protein PAXRUDRAFT_831610 [Paxillus rubicundulus Ve08.2h10]
MSKHYKQVGNFSTKASLICVRQRLIKGHINQTKFQHIEVKTISFALTQKKQWGGGAIA